MQEVLSKTAEDPKAPLQGQEFYELSLLDETNELGTRRCIRQAHAQWSEIDGQIMWDQEEIEHFWILAEAKRRYAERKFALAEKGFTCSDMDPILPRFWKNSIICVVVFFLSVSAFALYGPLDRNGWIPHSHDTPVWIQGDWSVGEYRNCQMLVSASRLFCGNWQNAGKGGSVSEFIGDVSNDDFEIAFKEPLRRCMILHRQRMRS